MAQVKDTISPYIYRVCGILIACSKASMAAGSPIPEGQRIQIDRNRLIHVECPSRDAPEFGVRAGREFRTVDGVLWLRVAQNDDAYCAEVGGVARYTWLREQGLLQISPSAEAALVEHYLWTTIVPLICTLQGSLVLHASAVETEAGAVLFLGASGSGKSTAAYLAQEAGAKLLADDCVLLREEAGEIVVWPGVSQLRMRKDVIEQFGISSCVETHALLQKRVLRKSATRIAPSQGVRLAQLVLLDSSSVQAPNPRDSHASIQHLAQQVFFGFAFQESNPEYILSMLARMQREIPYAWYKPGVEQLSLIVK